MRQQSDGFAISYDKSTIVTCKTTIDWW